ncbi:MAG: hypothetical protein DRH04_09305 [Deltaproteobacteria bacterium]|nr:MAG: hypothetical protein DRH04_09305 [Deltaproteobacteria bacterium]
MFLAMELWQERGLSQSKFCIQEKISLQTFGYWYRKYKRGKVFLPNQGLKESETFIPIELPRTVHSAAVPPGYIKVFFPNGVHINCPAGIDIQQLKTLINF